MRGKKPYNIRNIEAHINRGQLNNATNIQTSTVISYLPFSRKMIFDNDNNKIINQPLNTHSILLSNNVSETQQLNEHINSKYGVSKYASNLVSGKMYKKI